jgi:tRNA (guanine10-N2)-methyltransferase
VDDLHTSVKANLIYFKRFEHTSFKFDVDSYGMSMMHEDKLDLIYSFAYTGLKGEVRLSNAEITFTIKLDHNNKRFFLGRLIGEGRRDLCEKFSLKTREYIGITSMEAELSLVMSNLGLVGPGQIVLDPFVGTGSFLYTTSAFGAYSIGCDIDGRQLRGDGEGSFRDNLVQYNIEQLVLGALVSDLKHHPWRKGMKFDSIITDPPYGVRAGAKKIGGFDFSRPNKLTKDPMERGSRYPKTIPYELADLVADLYDFAADYLKIGGRLVFWYPVDKGTRIGFTKEMLPTDPRFHQVAACCQSLRDFDRWLIVASLI